MGLTNREPEQTFEEIMFVIGDNLSDLVSSDDAEHGEDHDNEETEQGKLSEDDIPSWGMGTITKTVPQCLERFWQKQTTLDELTQLEWEDAADHCHKGDKKYGTFELWVLSVIHPQTDDDTAGPTPTTFRERMERLDIVPGIS